MKDLIITNLDTITVFSLAGDYLFTLDELQNAKIANTQDKQDITGKGGRKLSSIKKNKGVTVSGTNGIVSGGLLEVQTGGKFETKNDAPILWTDYLAIEENAATTNYKAAGDTGNEIYELYIKNSDGTLGEKLTQGAAVGDKVFTYDPATKTLNFKEGTYTKGTEIVVYYFRQIKGDVLGNASDRYSEKCQMYVDASAEDPCGSIYHVQFYVPKADFNGNFDFEMGDNQTVHAFEAESLAGGCGSANKDFWTYTVFGTDAGDA